MERVAETRKKMVSALEEYEFKKVVDAAMSLSDFGNAYFQSKELWNLVKSDRTACARELKNCLQLVKALSVLLEPVMPSTMRSVQAQLGLTTTYFSDATVEVEPLRLPKPALPFAKIDEKKIGAMEAILNERVAKVDLKGPAKEPGGEAAIKLDDFKKMDLRTARVVEAEPVQKSDKLLRITAQVGDETRQIVAGIAKDYAPADLIGTDVVVLINLQPVKLMGIESHGMLLAAEYDGRSVLIRPARKMPSGTRIK
jgi:methionyl-tRNA synthetase